MTELQEEILNRFIPEYEEIKDQLEKYTDYELNLIKSNLPDRIDDLQDCINVELQWDIIGNLCGSFINDWDNFYFDNEDLIMDHCYDSPFISYNNSNNSYEICKDTIIDICKDMLSQAKGDYILNEEVDFSKLISHLNKYYPVKFCEA